MGYKVSGVITQIGEKKELANGAMVLDYVVEETAENGYKTPYGFNIYKTGEFTEFIDKFIEYNKVGDNVTVEFNIRGKEHNDRIYNNLSHWRCDKVEQTLESMSDNNCSEGDDPLPF